MAAQETRNVLALYSSIRALPANVEGDRGLRDALVDTPQRHVEFYAEFLDVPRFGGDAYVDTRRDAIYAANTRRPRRM